MSKSAISWFEMLLITLSITATYTAHADAPSACKFLTPAAVSAALGKPVSGGIVSTVDHSGATASSCMYMAGATIVVLRVDERGTAGEATKEYGSQLDDSHAKDKDKKGSSDEQKTVLEAGIGEAAFSDDTTNGSVRDITAVHGSRIFKLGLVGGASVPHEQLRNLMLTAVSH
jgi:hypothetical protein